MIDEISLQILKILQKKARIPNVEVARQVGMAPSAVLERIRKLEKQGFIDGYEVRLNPKRFRRNQVAYVTIKPDAGMDAKSGMRMGRQLSAIAEVQEVHHVAGEDGFLIKVRVPDAQSLGHFIQTKLAPLAGVAATRTAIVMSTFKETARIPIDDIDVE
jgi:Lrp/AsnC family leucine-responsive transcriptional regulator